MKGEVQDRHCNRPCRRPSLYLRPLPRHGKCYRDVAAMMHTLTEDSKAYVLAVLLAPASRSVLRSRKRGGQSEDGFLYGRLVAAPRPGVGRGR